MVGMIAALMAATLAASSDTGVATQQQAADQAVVPAASNEPDPEKVICVRDAPTGTRMVKRRTCRTRAQWEALAEAARRNAADIQSKGALISNNSVGDGSVNFGQGP